MNDKVFIDGKIYDVVTDTEYRNNSNMYNASETCIVMGDYILPVRSSRDSTNMVGYYPGQFIDRFVMPSCEQKNIYSTDNIVDFKNVANISDMIAAQEKLNMQQNEFLVSSDNIFKPNIDPINDQPLAIALKQAVIDKNIDINKYAHRFGPDFNNDRRKFGQSSISINKFTSIASKLDLKATIIIEDANPNVPNPMGHKIVVDLIDTNGGDE
jgi:hypothetical protein